MRNFGRNLATMKSSEGHPRAIISLLPLYATLVSYQIAVLTLVCQNTIYPADYLILGTPFFQTAYVVFDTPVSYLPTLINNHSQRSLSV